ncbi:plasmid mobilization relaxosome protein MobC [Streptomyces sp. NPDC000405]|uniref:plasmid mobilization relaxosome protein MobC n=1 Tax=Streptomyces sp. NPDC000405 TaxID=3161033 RepID=UPI00398CEC6A
MAVASWIADAALNVAKMRLVPVSADLKDVLQELIESRRQLRRVGNDLNQLSHVRNAGATVTEQQLAAMAQRVDAAVKRVDEATLQVMRERKPRS